MSRRAMLGVTAGLFSWAFMPRYAEAASAGNDPRLLVVVLRGGMDGISTRRAASATRTTSRCAATSPFPTASTITLNSFFGLHPALPNFGAYYKAGEAAVVHATCVPLRNRSHFDAQDNLENGLPGARLQCDRLAQPPAHRAAGRRADQVEGRHPDRRSAAHPARTGAGARLVADLVRRTSKDPTLYLVRTLYRDTRSDSCSPTLDRGLRADRLAERAARHDGDISGLRKGFRGAGAADRGGRRAAHRGAFGRRLGHALRPGRGVTGAMAGVLGELDRGDPGFQDRRSAQPGAQTVIVMVTEFGRTVRVNGDDGTDHGVGTVALLAGGAVNGGKVFGDWPGLAPAKLYEDSDLRPTTDIRSVFKGVLRDHLGVPTTLLNTTIFPHSAAIAPIAGLIQAGASAPAVAEADAGATAAPLRVEPPIAKYRRANGTG